MKALLMLSLLTSNDGKDFSAEEKFTTKWQVRVLVVPAPFRVPKTSKKPALICRCGLPQNRQSGSSEVNLVPHDVDFICSS